MDASSPVTPPPAPPAAGEDKTVAILAYITIIGFIVAIVMHGSKKTRLGTFHLRQMLGIILTGIAAGIIGMIPILGWILIIPMWIFLLVLWVVGLIAAAKGECKPTIVFGNKYQQWFGTAFD